MGDGGEGMDGLLDSPLSHFSFYNYAPRIASEQQAEHHGPWADMVCFYLGCSFGFEGRLKEAGVPVRNVEQGTNVSMYRVCTNILKYAYA